MSNLIGDVQYVHVCTFWPNDRFDDQNICKPTDTINQMTSSASHRVRTSANMPAFHKRRKQGLSVAMQLAAYSLDEQQRVLIFPYASQIQEPSTDQQEQLASLNARQYPLVCKSHDHRKDT